MKTVAVELVRVDFMPSEQEMKPNVLYYSERFGGLGHLCLCGCGGWCYVGLTPNFLIWKRLPLIQVLTPLLTLGNPIIGAVQTDWINRPSTNPKRQGRQFCITTPAVGFRLTIKGADVKPLVNFDLIAFEPVQVTGFFVP